MTPAPASRTPLGKTTRPLLSEILPRERVFALLDASRDLPLTWVSGPPGSGKTTAVASWLDHAGVRCLWYRVDEGDADPATFFYYLGQAAAELEGAERSTLPLLTPEYHAGLIAFTRRYAQELYARLKPPFVIVFDGYHEVPASSPLHEAMREALRELPPGGRAIVVSRVDPPSTLARLRANSQLAHIGWEELRLTREETATIAAQRRPGLGAEALAALYAKTQGWAAGLVLLLQQARMGVPIAEAPNLATRQLVFDYLAGEILQKSDARTQEFLLQTAHLPQATPALAQALSGEPAAAETLARLHRENYFVALHEAGGEPVYQYHPMFREFLLARAQEAMPKERRRQLQRDAAALMEGAGQVEEAVALAREAHDWESMARLVERHAGAMLAQGRAETLVHWIEDLPPETQQAHPWTAYWAAACQVQRAPREGRLGFERAFELFRAQGAPDEAGMVLACSGAMYAILYELDDFSLLDRWIAVLDDMTRAGVRLPSAEAEARVASSMFISLTLRQPQRRDIEEWIGKGLAASQRVPDPNLKMFVGLLAALTLMWTGVYPRALGLIEAMRRIAGTPGVSPFSLLTLKNVEAMYHMLNAEREPCLAATREGLELARATGVHTWTFQLLVYGYGGALGDADLAAAAPLARQLEAQAGGAGRFNLCLYHHFQAWEAMLRKDLMRALQQEKIAQRIAVEVGCPFFEVLTRLALAQVLAECGDERKCISQLTQMRAIARRIDSHHLEYTCLLGFADIALEHGRARPGLNALRRGFALGREHAYRHFLWWRPASIARLCAHALAEGIETEYAKHLVTQRALTPERPPLEVPDWPWHFRVRTLGGFRLLRHGEPLAAASGKAQRRPLELLKVLIAHGGERIAEELITDAMWPRIDGDSAHRSFTSTLHRLRKLLGEDRALVLHEGKLSLDARYFWTDVWALERLCAEIDDAAQGARADPAELERLQARLLELARGPFLANEPEEPWSLRPRERLRARVERALGQLGAGWEAAGQPGRARLARESAVESASAFGR
jgi:LuxR family transcriptional regulator, maltose regulon positive regulatory protein